MGSGLNCEHKGRSQLQSGGIVQVGVDPAFIWNTVYAANEVGNENQCGVSAISKIYDATESVTLYDGQSRLPTPICKESD